MRAVQLTVDQWKRIRKELYKEHPKTVFMLRNKMKNILGFTVREHKALVPKMDGGYYELEIHLDFYSERKRTMFLLKFSEIVSEKKDEKR